MRLTTDYMTALRKHAEQVLRYKLLQGALSSTLIEYIVCVFDGSEPELF